MAQAASRVARWDPPEGESLALALMPKATDAAADDDARLAAQLAGNAVDDLPAGALAAKLRAARAEGRQLRVKLGIDPTAPSVRRAASSAATSGAFDIESQW